MNNHKGLTIIPHEDLVSAVNNWRKLNTLYSERESGASEYAERVWKGKIYSTELGARLRVESLPQMNGGLVMRSISGITLSKV